MEDNNDYVVNCMQCVHFYVTWEPNFPKACKLFAFKSKHLPSVAVYEATGTICLAFERKGTFANRKHPPKHY